MRLAAMRNDAYVFEVISIVAVKHRAIIYRARQIGRHTAARREHELDTLDPASSVETDVVINDEVMPLARHDHVVIAVEAQLAGPSRFVRHQSGNTGNQRRLAFFAAKGATHAAAFNDDIFRQFTDRRSHQVLHLTRMLRGAVQVEIAVLGGKSCRDLPLEIKLVLPANIEAALQAVFCISQRRLTVASRDRLARQNKGSGRERGARIENCFQVFVFYCCQLCCLACLIDRFRGNGEHGLPHILNESGCENRIVGYDRPAVVFTRNIGRGHDGHHAGRPSNSAEVHFPDFGVWPRTHADGKMQQILPLGYVIDIYGLATDMQVSAVMRYRTADRAGNRLACVLPTWRGLSVHSHIRGTMHCRWNRDKSAAGDCRKLCGGIQPLIACPLSG